MTGLERRNNILALLVEAGEPLSASFIARKLGVSRQIIVGDVALLRAEGNEIIATPRGYIKPVTEEAGIVRRVACVHSNSQTEEELNIFVDSGCKVVDVIVEHPVYGQLTGLLEIASRIDVKDFIEKCNSEKAHSLSELTDGVHLHTVECPSEAVWNKVLDELSRRDMLWTDNGK